VFILKLLGGASLEGPDGPLTGRVAQRRRVAVLALLAMSRRQGLSREKLAAMLWPESDGDRARHLLSDTVYVINRGMGGEVVAAVADELRLRPERLSCDARLFEEAVGRGALDEAVRMYHGPFLDGFFVEGSEEFERWSSSERERLHGLYCSALERLASERASGGDARGAIDCWRRLAADDPLNSRVAHELASAMARAGDRAGALQTLQSHAATLKQELDIAPPEDVAALVRTLKAAPPSSEPAHPAVATTADTSTTPAPAPIPDAPPPPRPASPWRLRRWAIAAAAAVVVLASGLRVYWTRPSAAVTPSSLKSVAVLPFADLSPARDHAYFSEGIAEELSTRLARVPGLKVAARTSAFSFKGADADVKTIGRALNVDAVLEGSVRQSEGQVRIAVRLVDARDGYQLWADTWDRAGTDVLAMQDEIATSVLRALGAGSTGLRSSEPAARSIDLAAFNLYLQGRYFWHQRTRDSLTTSAAAFERAVALAPEYAEAHSGVADAYAVLAFYDHLPPREAYPRAKAAALRAIALDPQLAQAHASLGYVALYYDWDWPAAERSLKRAVELNPSYSVGHQWLANYYVARGRFDEAERAMRRAREIDPLSLIASAALGWVHYYQRNFDAAVAQCRRTTDMNADFEQAWLWAGWAHEAAGRYGDAVQMLDRAAALSRRGPTVLVALGRAHALSGNTAAARQILAELQRDHAGYLPAYEMAKLHLALNDNAEALTWLRRAYDQHEHSLVFLAVDPQLDRLRSNPAFAELTAKVGVLR
jgi:TolB-like protein/DNA-binding SARP family transcriptional activator/Tfp pilus assembly protein PilF